MGKLGSKILILGLGNILLQDEGLGVHAVKEFRRQYKLPPHVELCDGGCLGLNLLPSLEDVERLLLIDAAEIHMPPGTIARLEDDEIWQRWESKLSAHEAGASDLLAATSLMGYQIEKVVLLAMQPGSARPGLELSSAVEAGLPQLVRMMAGELARWGVRLTKDCTTAGSGNHERLARSVTGR